MYYWIRNKIFKWLGIVIYNDKPTQDDISMSYLNSTKDTILDLTKEIESVGDLYKFEHNDVLDSLMYCAGKYNSAFPKHIVVPGVPSNTKLHWYEDYIDYV